MDPIEEKTSKTVDIYRDTWVRFLGMCFLIFSISVVSVANRAEHVNRECYSGDDPGAAC